MNTPILLKERLLLQRPLAELMENFIEQDDLVILGNRYESQLCALEMDASCLVVCQNATVSKTIKKLAEEEVVSLSAHLMIHLRWQD